MMKRQTKICIVHDWLVTYGGAERVLEEMLTCFPEADVFALVDHVEPGNRGFIKDKSVTTSYVQKLPFSRSKYRSYLPVMMYAVEQFDLSAYDIVVSSSHAVAKGVLTGPDQLHICMCYSPVRYAWDLQHQYLREAGLDRGFRGLLAKWMLHKVRIWDYRTGSGVDSFIAISNFVARRIRKSYGRKSETIYPPVETEKFSPSDVEKQDFYVTCSRMVPYKRIDLIVDTFSRLQKDKQLIVLGDGPDFEKIKSLAGGNVKLMGRVSFDELHRHLCSAKAFIFAAEEDFGIAPLEAQSCGTPVIALQKGGAVETVVGLSGEAPTGVFFPNQTDESLSDAIEVFEKNSSKITSEACRSNALRFSNARFHDEFREFVDSTYESFRESL